MARFYNTGVPRLGHGVATMTKTTAAHGQYTTHGVPHGVTSLTPHLVVSPAEEALVFYAKVLGAELGEVTRMGGLVGHAELRFASGRCTLSDPMAAYGLVAPSGEDKVSASFALYVPDVDAVVARALEAGAKLREPVSTFVSGDRYGSILDPFGVRWALMTRVEDLSPQESAARVAAWAASQGQG